MSDVGDWKRRVISEQETSMADSLVDESSGERGEGMDLRGEKREGKKEKPVQEMRADKLLKVIRYSPETVGVVDRQGEDGCRLCCCRRRRNP